MDAKIIDLSPKKPDIKKGIKWERKFTRAGTVNGRPTFTIMNMSTITFLFPKWYVELIRLKHISPKEVEHNFRLLKEELKKNDLEYISHSFYDDAPYIIVKSLLDGHPDDAKIIFSSQLRLFYKSLNNFFGEFKQRVDLLKNYKYDNINKKVRYCAVGPRKKRAFPFLTPFKKKKKKIEG